MPPSLKERIAEILTVEKIRQVDLARGAEVTKGWVNQWLDGTAKSISYDAAKAIAKKWGYAIEWLMNGSGPKKAAFKAPTSETALELSPDEKAMIVRYRAADPRWQLSLRLLAALATEDQIEAATDVNVVVARIMGKKPAEVRYALDARVAESFGPAPHVAPQQRPHGEVARVSERTADYNSGRPGKTARNKFKNGP